MSRKRADSEEDLRRLRAEVNRLRRRLQALQAQYEETLRREAQRTRTLQDELQAVKSSRVWRTAVLLRSGRVLDALKSFAGRATAAGDDSAAPSPPDDGRARRYRAYLAANAMSSDRRSALHERVRSFERSPLVSVVMPVYNTPAPLLESAMASVAAQIYENWELCLVDDASDRAETARVLEDVPDPRVRVRRLDENSDIAAATNAGIEMAAGEYLAFMDHDDELSPDALLEVVACINEHDPDLIYTDEDYIDAAGERVNPHFKPDFSPDLLMSHNYITHLLVVRRDLAERVGRLHSELDGAQDYDFVLRATEQAHRIRHIPRVLYHWRMSGTSTSGNAASKPDAMERGRLALQKALQRRGCVNATVAGDGVAHFYRVRYPLRGRPLVSIVVPFRDKPELLHCVVGDVIEKSSYTNFELIGVSNNSGEEETHEAMRDLAALDGRVRFIEHDVPFNFSAIVNQGVRSCSGGHIVLLNNDIRIISADWLEALLEYSQRPDVGAVGGKLYYPDGRIQHAGVIVGIAGYAGHAHKGFPGDHQGYFNRLQVVQNVSAVTGAFMMVKAEAFNSVEGFDEQRFTIACNDVDFCLRLRERGYWNVFTPHAEAWHVESASRGYESTPEKEERFARERSLFFDRHRDVLEQGDPFYNPNLTRDSQDFSVRVPGE